MTHFESVTVTDTLGESFPLAACSILCARCGELDFSDPVAVIYPDGETVILAHDLQLTGPGGESLDLDSVGFEQGDS